MPADAEMRETFMRRALELARAGLQVAGALPFAAVVVKDGVMVGEGLNRVVALGDPTAHGEIEAIRDACRRLGTPSLAGCEIYTTGEPCSMCVATMYLAGIARLYYGVASADTAVFLGQVGARDARWARPIGAIDLRRQLSLPVGERAMPAEPMLADEAKKLLEAFIQRPL